MSSSEDKYTVIVSRFSGSGDDDFHLWPLRMKAALTKEKVASVLLKDEVSTDTTDEALSLIISALGDISLRDLQHCTTAGDFWKELQVRYVGRTLINKLSAPSSLLNIKTKGGEHLGDHIAKTETGSSILASVDDLVLESMQLALLVFSS